MGRDGRAEQLLQKMASVQNPESGFF